MAIYTNLPVYEECYQLLLSIVTYTRHIQRDLRYTLEEQLKQNTVDMLVLIFKANKTEKKAGYIASAREKLVEVQVMSRILNDLKQNAIRRRATQPGRNAAQSRLAAACQGNFRQSACYIRVTCFSFKTTPEDMRPRPVPASWIRQTVRHKSGDSCSTGSDSEVNCPFSMTGTS